MLYSGMLLVTEDQLCSRCARDTLGETVEVAAKREKEREREREGLCSSNRQVYSVINVAEL